jgi:transposase-like protein
LNDLNLKGEEDTLCFWYGVLEELKTRGVQDILFLCSDGVAGFRKIIEQAYPKTIHRRWVVHIIKNITSCVPKK